MAPPAGFQPALANHTTMEGRSLEMVLRQMAGGPEARRHVVAWRAVPPRPGRFAPQPDWLSPRLVNALRLGGVTDLYEHQRHALELARQGRNVLVVTPTASGKSLCHHLPVLQAILEEPAARALYIFPAKALARDQAEALGRLAARAALPTDGLLGTYDGDAARSERRAAVMARIFFSNPDMVHCALLPGHRRWATFLAGLRFVVLDELHAYRGVFGSHVAHVLRRLLRLCRHYGSRPRFLCASATIANPAEFAQALLGEEVAVVAGDGSPAGEKHFLVVNPYAVPGAKGMEPALQAAASWAAGFLAAGFATIAFARTRAEAELLHNRLREHLARRGRPDLDTAVYRGGYLPEERRAVEQGLKTGRLAGVVSTSALELGVDVGGIDATVLCGFPGTVAATWQRAGRAGRRGQPSATVLVAARQPLDQYLAGHPDHLFARHPESAALNPENPRVAAWHRACAQRELPSAAGALPAGRAGALSPGAAASCPPRLRGFGGDGVAILDAAAGCRLGDAAAYQAPALLHPGAVYWHQGKPYRLQMLDLEHGVALARPWRGGTRTAARTATVVKVTAIRASRRFPVGAGAPCPGTGTPHAFDGWGTCTVAIQPLCCKEFDAGGRLRKVAGLDGPAAAFPSEAYWLGLDAGTAEVLPRPILAMALRALAHLITVLLPLFVLCDPNDLGTAIRAPAPEDGAHTLFLYDRHEGGSGCAALLFARSPEILDAALRLARRCPCHGGCPLCTGPSRPGGAHPGAPAMSRKEAALSLLRLLIPA